MGISTEQAMKMVAEKMDREAQPAQPEPSEKPEPEQPAPEPKEEPKAEPEPEPEKSVQDPEPAKEEPKEEPKEEKPEEDKKEKSDRKPPKQKYSHEERVAHAFAIEKQKRKEQHAKDRARIKELEAELEKYKGLKLEDFGEKGTEDYVNWKLKERDMQNEVKTTKERMERDDEEELRKETERRVNLSFPDEADRDDYNELIRNNGPKFYEALQQADPKGVVLDYLNSVERYPIVLRKLMTDMDALRYVFRDKDPYVLRMNLHQFTQDLLNGKKPEEPESKAEPEPEQPKKQPELKPLPVIGKQVTAGSKPSEPVHDRAYWNDYLRKHPHG
jgi:hypothetical protein